MAYIQRSKMIDGRQLANYPPEEAMTDIQNYFKDCNEKGVFPDEAGMLVWMGLFPEDKDTLCKRDSRFVSVFKRAEMLQESWLSRHAVGGKNASAALALLKERKYGSVGKEKKADMSVKLNVSEIEGGLSRLAK